MDEKLAKEMLANIAYAGETATKAKPIIGGNLSHILNLSSGSPRIQTNIVSRFKLILGQPEGLLHLGRFEIRCCLCKRVISYPCWYYSIHYAVNHFHYFVCFDSESNNKPSTKCYRKEE